MVLEVDHVVPRARGGTNDPDNLVTSCWECNAGKSDRPLPEVPELLSEMLEPELEPPDIEPDEPDIEVMATRRGAPAPRHHPWDCRCASCEDDGL